MIAVIVHAPGGYCPHPIRPWLAGMLAVFGRIGKRRLAGARFPAQHDAFMTLLIALIPFF
jgi:hypothetical protein